MPTRNVVLTEHQEGFIGALVATGRYNNASEVLREALRLMERREQLEAAKIEALRARLDAAERDVARDAIDEFSASLLDEIDLEERNEYATTAAQ
ncbi:MAG: type II toxin-antitoxin system ParD family antitoxin [Gammaproteobacteria bacterium]